MKLLCEYFRAGCPLRRWIDVGVRCGKYTWAAPRIIWWSRQAGRLVLWSCHQRHHDAWPQIRRRTSLYVCLPWQGRWLVGREHELRAHYTAQCASGGILVAISACIHRNRHCWIKLGFCQTLKRRSNTLSDQAQCRGLQLNGRPKMTLELEIPAEKSNACVASTCWVDNPQWTKWVIYTACPYGDYDYTFVLRSW